MRDIEPLIDIEASENQFGILQTQEPHPSGTPYVSSHISGLDYEAHNNRKNYFVRAQYHLGYEEPGVHSILQDWFDGGRNIDPNMRTISIEMTGYDFENRSHFPSKQQIANAISLIWALMRRYNITANNIFGHNEIQLNKPDPGKKFLAFMRFLIGAKAMLENDPQMNKLVFGNFLYEQVDTLQATQRYFKYVYDYLLMISKPRATYEWEGLSGYWFLKRFAGQPSWRCADQPQVPLSFDLENSPARDAYTPPQKTMKASICTGRSSRLTGMMPRLPGLISPLMVSAFTWVNLLAAAVAELAIFRHRQRNGCQVLSIYSHLDSLIACRSVTQYPITYPLGEIKQDLEHSDPFLHFAMAYGGTWDSDLRDRPAIPLNVGASWIRDRYQHPFSLDGRRLWGFTRQLPGELG